MNKNLGRVVKILKKCANDPTNIRPILSALWVKRIIKKPILYKDQFGVINQLRPYENLQHIFKYQSHLDDLGLARFISRFLRTGMTVIDVGANKGDFSLFAAIRVAPSGRVYAIEPVQNTFRWLSENIARQSDLRGYINLYDLAIYKADGEIVMNVFEEQFSGWNSLGFSEMGFEGKTITPVSTQKVTALTLDTFCLQNEINYVDLLKIDVEGYEVDVLEGCSKLISDRQISHLIFEISLAPLAGAGQTAHGVLKAFTDKGLTIFQILESGDLLSIPDINSFNPPYFANYVATFNTRMS